MGCICTKMEKMDRDFFDDKGQSLKLRTTLLNDMAHEAIRTNLKKAYNSGILRYVVVAHVANLFYTARKPYLKIGGPVLSTTLLLDDNIPESMKIEIRGVCKTDKAGFINNRLAKQIFAVLKSGVFFQPLINSQKKGVCTIYVLTDKELREDMGWTVDDASISRDLRIGEKMAGIDAPVIETVLEVKI